MPLQQTSGNDTQDAYGGGAAAVPNYIENVFSTYLYTGTASALTITNNIDLSTKGGLVWIKSRSSAYGNNLFDTARGVNNYLITNNTGQQNTYGAFSDLLTSFNTNGFNLGSDSSGIGVNTGLANYASWTFRKQPKFFDIVTYTGDGSSARSIPHNLKSTPGCFIVKRTDSTGQWVVYHQGITNAAQQPIVLNSNSATYTDYNIFAGSPPNSVNFNVGYPADAGASYSLNTNGATYVAYLFASNAGGFGLTGTGNVITCGSFTCDGLGNSSVNLGWEPQWVLTKQTNGTGDWNLFDTMRGLVADPVAGDNILFPNSAQAESIQNPALRINATGIYTLAADGFFNGGGTYIYIAIRRGPMAVPTDPTKVFAPSVISVSGSADTVTTNFVVDLSASSDNLNNGTNKANFIDRLRGSYQTNNVYLTTAKNNSETGNSHGMTFDNNTGYLDYFNYNSISSSSTFSYWNFRRAPSFFDEVCYTGTGSATTINHNLTVVPELIIIKSRSDTYDWYVYNKTTGAGNTLYLDANNASTPTSAVWNNTTPTNSVFSVGSNGVNGSGSTYVAYLFATCPGVSKVGLYTGTGATQTISCGFGAGGARFILAKRTDSTGDWYVWDSANGLTSGSSPYLQWDTTNAQTTGNNGTYASSGGFTLTSASPVNTSGGSFIFLAIA